MREKVVYFYINLFIAIVVFISIGCSENLTNDKAKQLILAATKYPVKKIASVEISQSPDQGILITKDEMSNYIKMLANKLISMNIHGIGSNGSEYYDVNLTDEGKKYVLQERTENNKIIIDVLLGEIIFEKIINIRKEDNGAGYNVKYLEEIGRITPFGVCLIDKTENEKNIRLILHNGKWKIE
ncbi:MAG: hypothetical protein ACYC6G_13480 [Desulfobaccales bacterium]